MEFADEVKCIREKLCLSQAEMAKILDVTEQTIRHWENGDSKPRCASIRKLKALCAKNKIELSGEFSKKRY